MDYITVKTLDGRDVIVNRAAIVTVGGPRKDDKQALLSGKATCLLTLVDGKFLAVVEDCEAIREQLQNR